MSFYRARQKRRSFPIRTLFAAVLVACSWSSFAATTVTVVSHNASTGDFQLTISGDTAAVRLDVQNGAAIDICTPGVSGAMVNDGTSVVTVTITATSSTCELMPHAAWPGIKATVNGEQKDLIVGTGVVFGVAPNPPGDLTADLSWTAPTTNTDGSPVSLSGYKVYWGTAIGNYPNVQAIGLTTTYEVTGLTPGTWYFVVTAVSTTGTESSFSNIATKDVGAPPPTDPCVSDPLTFGVTTWPSATTGARRLDYNTNKRAKVTHEWLPSQRATAVDDRNCTVTVVR